MLHDWEADQASFVEVSAAVEAGKVHGFCEICIRMLQMKQHRLTQVCSGLTDTFYITVSAARAVIPTRSPLCVSFLSPSLSSASKIWKASSARTELWCTGKTRGACTKTWGRRW